MVSDKRGKRRGVSGARLKWVALTTMLIDHLGAVLLLPYAETVNQEWLAAASLMRCIGRASFPIYVFLLAEALYYTKSKRLLCIRMLVFAAISELPYDLALHGQITCQHQNIFFTLAIGAIGVCAAEYLLKKSGSIVVKVLMTACVAALCAGVSSYINTGYSWCGIAAIFLAWILRKRRVQPGLSYLAIGCMLLPEGVIQICFVYALPVVMEYNGKRGRQPGKLFFYEFYPAHLTVLAIVRHILLT